MKAIYFFMCIVICVDAKKSLPSFLEQCYRKHSNLSDCIRRNLESLKLQYPKGPIPDLGIPSLYPLTTQSVLFDHNTLFYEITDLAMWHIDDYCVNSVDGNAKYFKLELLFPSLVFESQYVMRGDILNLTVDGDGIVNGNIMEIQATYTATLGTTKKLEQKYLTLESSEINLNLDRYTIYFEDLVKTSADENDDANKVLNEHQIDFINLFKSFLAGILQSYIDTPVKYIFENYSLDDLLPEN